MIKSQRPDAKVVIQTLLRHEYKRGFVFDGSPEKDAIDEILNEF